jgi:signal transduction histidine kinase/HAMP domain-containing protein
MGLRAKLAAIFLALLFLPIVTVSALEIDRTITVMVEDLGESGILIINQTFEQIRAVLGHAKGDPVAALRNDDELRMFLDSSQAFGKGVVYARIENLDGSTIVGAQAEPKSGKTLAVPPFEELRAETRAWWPPARIRVLWGERTYELTRPVEINNRPFAVIKVGLSTGLIAAAVRRSVEYILSIAAMAIVLSLLGAVFAGSVLLRPVAAIMRGVEQMTAGREEVSLEVEGKDELSTLAQKFNQLSRRIKANQKEWETERGQFFNIFRSITDAMLLLDSAGVILFANAEAQGRLGLPSGGLADGKPLSMLLGKDNPLTRMTQTAYASGTEVHDVALDLGDPSNPTRFLVSISSLGQGPNPPGLLVILRDLEPVRELENVVEYSGRLVRLGGLLSGVAHQIRNPLNAMSLQLELLRQQADQGRPVERQVQALRTEIERLDQAVDALMRFMRPEELKLSDVALNDLLSEVAGQVATPGIRVECQLDPKVTSTKSDRALLAEALKNVASNAVEAMPQGGTLTLGSVLGKDGFVELFITDQGEGIPLEHLDRVFDLYFTTKEGGSGLGLPLALRAIDLHRGTVNVQSKVGSGTTVRIRLPIGEEPRIPAGLEPPAN